MIMMMPMIMILLSKCSSIVCIYPGHREDSYFYANEGLASIWPNKKKDGRNGRFDIGKQDLEVKWDYSVRVLHKLE